MTFRPDGFAPEVALVNGIRDTVATAIATGLDIDTTVGDGSTSSQATNFYAAGTKFISRTQQEETALVRKLSQTVK